MNQQKTRNYVAVAQNTNKQYVASFATELVLVLKIILSLTALYEVKHTCLCGIESRVHLRSFYAVHVDTISAVSWNNLNLNLLLFDEVSCIRF